MINTWQTTMGITAAVTNMRPCSICGEPITAPYAWRQLVPGTRDNIQRIHFACTPGHAPDWIVANYVARKLLK